MNFLRMINQLVKMLKYIAFLLVFFVTSTSCSKTDDDLLDNKEQVKLPPDNYELSWADEFNGSDLDNSKWMHRQLGVRRQGFNSSEAISVHDGYLDIQTFSRGDTVFTGMIGTMETYQTTYGYFECRALIEDIFPNYWGAFWLQSENYGRTLDPYVDGMEIDIFEFFVGNPYSVHHYLHWNGYREHHQQAFNVTKNSIPFNDGEFHIYALEWTPDYYKFFVDGRVVWEYRDLISPVDQYMILSTEVSDRQKFKDNGKRSTHFLIDYVRVYKKRI